MATTIKDVARLAGVSTATVSYVINNSASVSEETRERVLAAIKQLDYHPNVVAKSLQGRRTNTIGFILSSKMRRISDPFFVELISGIADEAANHGFYLLLSSCPQGAQEGEVYRELIKTGRVDGLIVADTRINDERLSYLIRERAPFVAFGRADRDLDFPYVDVDGFAGVYEGVQHLIARGHRRIGLIKIPEELVCAGHRFAGYRAALQDNGLAFDRALVRQGDLSQDSGYRAMADLLDSTSPSAVMVCSDVMAFGAMTAVREQGLKVGQDVAVVGFDDIQMAAHSHPPLTTIRQPIYDIGTRLVRMLIQLLTEGEVEERHVILKPTLVVRRSSG
ncbi:MAG: LacI family DNA-binding transcriptional regulator [Anaerolineae bacterium]